MLRPTASLSSCQAPIWGLRPDFYYCQIVADLLMWGALSDERTGLPFTIAAGPRQRILSWVRIPSGLVTIFYCLRFEAFQTWRARSSYLYPPGIGWPSYTPRSESESYITTDGQSASLSWNKAPIWGLRPDFYYCQLWFCWCGALSLTRGRVWRLQLLLGLASVIFLGSESLETRDHILLSQIWDFPFRRLLQLAGSWWRYSNPPPNGGYSLYKLHTDHIESIFHSWLLSL
jgi:hypothetical protein